MKIQLRQRYTETTSKVVQSKNEYLLKRNSVFVQNICSLETTSSDDRGSFVLKEELKQEMSSWKFPLNFIDFETSATALPFYKGRRPYEQVAFQFSHHTANEQGVVKHESEYINFDPGIFPNFEFMRELKKALSKNSGSIFMYAPHENTILNARITGIHKNYYLCNKIGHQLLGRGAKDDRPLFSGKKLLLRSTYGRLQLH